MSAEIALVIPAAGCGSRFGGPKQCAQYNGSSLIRRAAMTGIQTGLDVIVVTGAYGAQVSVEIRDLALTQIPNPTWEDGLGNSIACGFRYLLAHKPQTEAAIVLLADQPQVSATALGEMLSQWEFNRDNLVVADYGQRIGPPCLFPRVHFKELASLAGEQGARLLLERYRSQLRTVVMPEAGQDIDTEQDLRELLS